MDKALIKVHDYILCSIGFVIVMLNMSAAFQTNTTLDAHASSPITLGFANPTGP